MSHQPLRLRARRATVLSSAAAVAAASVVSFTSSTAKACDPHLLSQSVGNIAIRSPAKAPTAFGNLPINGIGGGGTPQISAVLIPTAFDRSIVRPMMPNEGRLEMRPNPFAPGGPRYGHEFTGWTDVRHPAFDGLGDILLGYDRYDRRIEQATTILTDNSAMPVTAMANVPRDLSHANRVYATQAGVSVIERQTRGYTSPAVGMPGAFNFPLDFATEEGPIMQQNVGGGRVNVYYARDLSSGAYGETPFPSFTAGGNNEAIFMAQRVAQGGGFIPITRNTHAHEMTHFMTDGLPLHVLVAAPDAFHSDDRRNIIGAPQYDPGQAMGTNIGTVMNPELVPWTIPDNDTVAGPSHSQGPGGAPKVGGISQLKRTQVFTPAGGANPDRGVFGDADSSPYLIKSENIFAGDRVDYNFAVDDWVTEDLGGGADVRPGGRESLYFTTSVNQPNTPADPAATADNGGKDKSGLGVFNNPGYHQGTFRFADIFSITSIFGDYDVNNSGDPSFRASALDYDVQFVLQNNSIVPGIVTDVYTEGWNLDTFAEDYVARWMSPADAIGVLVTAHLYNDLVTGQAIGNVQIDAVIVGNIPEPGIAGVAVASIAMFVRRRRP